MAITVNKLQPVYDLALEGVVDTNGKIKEVWNEEAVSNALKMWLASAQGEILRDPFRGGYLFPFLVKPMTEENRYNIESALRDGLRQDFEPYMVVKEISVDPDYTNRRWNIQISTYTPAIRAYVQVSEKIKNFV